MAVKVKRVYEHPAKSDGSSVLVDRWWPRGLKKDAAALDWWLRDLAPSDELRQWFHAYPTAWGVFRHRYVKELVQPEALAALEMLYELLRKGKVVTLLYASRNQEHNNAVALKELLEGRRKPPTGSGGASAQTQRSRSMRRLK